MRLSYSLSKRSEELNCQWFWSEILYATVKLANRSVDSGRSVSAVDSPLTSVVLEFLANESFILQLILIPSWSLNFGHYLIIAMVI